MKKWLLIVLIACIAFSCVGCSLHESCEDNLRDMEEYAYELQHEIESLQESLYKASAKAERVLGCLEEIEGYYVGDYSRFMEKDEAEGYILYAQELCMEMAQGSFGIDEYEEETHVTYYDWLEKLLGYDPRGAH